MLKTEEAAQAQNTFNQGSMNLLNEELNRSVLTRVQSTGLYHSFSKLFGEAITPLIERSPTPNEDQIYGGTELEDLSDIIIDTDSKDSESTCLGDTEA